MRLTEDKNILDNFTLNFIKVVEKYTEYIVVSGFVIIASGRARGTEDIDMIIKKITKEEFIKLHKDLIKHNFECMQIESPEELYEEYLLDKLSLRYIKKDQPLPEMEIKIEADALDSYQFKTKTKLDLTGLDIWFSSVEMNIAFKEELLKSQKDLEDAKHLRIVYSEQINENEIVKIKQMINKYRK